MGNGLVSKICVQLDSLSRHRGSLFRSNKPFCFGISKQTNWLICLAADHAHTTSNIIHKLIYILVTQPTILAKQEFSKNLPVGLDLILLAQDVSGTQQFLAPVPGNRPFPYLSHC